MKLQRTTSYVINYYYITIDELLNPETERLILGVCVIPVWNARGSIRTTGSAFDIASLRLGGEKKVQKYWFRQNVRRPHVRHLCIKGTLWRTSQKPTLCAVGKGI